MPEVITATTETKAPEQTTVKLEVPPQETQEVKEQPKEDLVSRVSKFKIETPKAKEETNPFGLSKEDYDKVQTDPVLSKFYKSMQSDYVKKTQEVAEQRKKIEEQSKQSSTWTAERLQQEMNKPDFVQAAQQITALNNPPNSGLTDTEYSALTDKEKAQLTGMQQELHQMKLQNWQMQQRQQDEQLKQKYADYAPDIVDTTISKLTKGEVQATREDIWKVIMHDENVKRAYQMGLQDKQLETKEKQQSASFDGFSTTPTNDIPKQEDKESNSAYFKRLAQRRLAEIKGAHR